MYLRVPRPRLLRVGSYASTPPNRFSSLLGFAFRRVLSRWERRRRTLPGRGSESSLQKTKPGKQYALPRFLISDDCLAKTHSPQSSASALPQSFFSETGYLRLNTANCVPLTSSGRRGTPRGRWPSVRTLPSLGSADTSRSSAAPQSTQKTPASPASPSPCPKAIPGSRASS